MQFKMLRKDISETSSKMDFSFALETSCKTTIILRNFKKIKLNHEIENA